MNWGIHKLRKSFYKSISKPHKVKGQSNVTLMLFTDTTRGGFTIRIPKWLRFPVIAFVIFMVLSVFFAVSKIASLESDIARYRYESHSKSYVIANKQVEFAEVEAVNEERRVQLKIIQDMALELKKRLEDLEAYKKQIDDKLGQPEGDPTGDVMIETEVLPLGFMDEELRVFKMAGPGFESGSDSNIVDDLEGFEAQWDDVFSLLAESLEAIESEKVSYEERDEIIDELIPLWEATPNIFPVASTIVTSYYGNRRNPFGRRGYEFHSGVDLKARYTDVWATASGKVVHKGYDRSRGYYVRIDHGYGFETLYAHLSKIYVEKGEVIERGDVIARSGNSGRSSGPHLHYEVHLNGVLKDPIDYLN